MKIFRLIFVLLFALLFLSCFDKKSKEENLPQIELAQNDSLKEEQDVISDVIEENSTNIEEKTFEPKPDEELLKKNSDFKYLSVESVFNEDTLNFKKSNLNLYEILYSKKNPPRRKLIKFSQNGKNYECRINYLSEDKIDVNYNNATLGFFEKDVPVEDSDEKIDSEILILEDIHAADGRFALVDCNFDGNDDFVYLSENNLNGEEFHIYFWNSNQGTFEDHDLAVINPEFIKEKQILREVIKIEENETDYLYRKWNGMLYEFVCKLNWKEDSGSDYLNISYTDNAELIQEENTFDLILSWYEKDNVEHVVIPKNYLELSKEDQKSLLEKYHALLAKIPE